jgi:hypothetical protein
VYRLQPSELAQTGGGGRGETETETIDDDATVDGDNDDVPLADGEGVGDEVTSEELASLEDTETETEEDTEDEGEDEELLLDFTVVDEDFDVASVELVRELDTLPALHCPVVVPLASAKSMRKWYHTVAFLAGFRVAVVCPSEPRSELCQERGRIPKAEPQ